MDSSSGATAAVRCVAGVLLAACTLLAQGNTASLSGVLRDEISGGPLAGAAVDLYEGLDTRLEHQPHLTAVADQHGFYSFSDLAARKFRMIVRYAGGTFEGGQPSVEAGEHQTVSLRLRPAGSVAGKVIDDEGHPVPDVLVSLVAREYFGGANRLLFARNAATNARGEYLLERVDAGRSWLVFAHPRAANLKAISDVPMDLKLREQALAAAFYPNSADVAGAAALTPRGGEKLEAIDIRMSRSRGYCVSATLRKEGTPAALRFEIALKEPSFGQSPNGGSNGPRTGGVAGADGKVRICGLTRGVYALDANGTALRGRAVIAVQDGDIDGIEVNAFSLRRLPVEITLRGGARAESVGTASLFLRGLVTSDTSVGKTPVPGAAEISLLPDSEYLFEAIAPAGYHVEDILFGGVSVAGKTIVAHGLDSPPVRIVVAPGLGAIDVTVTDSKGLSAGGGNVVAIREGAIADDGVAGSLVKESVKDDGQARLRNLAPGRYWVMTMEESLEAITPELIARVLQARATRGQLVEVPDMGSAAVKLSVPDLR